MQVDVIEKELAAAKAGYDKLTATDIPAFNKAIRASCRLSATNRFGDLVIA